MKQLIRVELYLVQKVYFQTNVNLLCGKTEKDQNQVFTFGKSHSEKICSPFTLKSLYFLDKVGFYSRNHILFADATQQFLTLHLKQLLTISTCLLISWFHVLLSDLAECKGRLRYQPRNISRCETEMMLEASYRIPIILSQSLPSLHSFVQIFFLWVYLKGKMFELCGIPLMFECLL